MSESAAKEEEREHTLTQSHTNIHTNKQKYTHIDIEGILLNV